MASSDVTWGAHGVPTESELTFSLGPTTLRVRRRQGEIRALTHPSADEVDGAPWTRWAAPPDTESIALSPVMPDRPLVVEPEEPFWLLEGAEARIYVRVPLWAKLEATSRGGWRRTLLRFPTLVASDTWWGTVEEGELCYWLSTKARRVIRAEHFEPHLCICPLQLVNRSDDDLHVDKIALRVAFLSIYRADQGLWSDETVVRYYGEAEGSRLETAGEPPREARGAELVSPPAERMARGFRARTFRRLRSITGLFG